MTMTTATPKIMDKETLDQLFTEARTHNAWLDKPVSDEQLKQIVDIMKWGPTSANCSPLRIVFVRSDEARAKLGPLLMEGNREKTVTAPVCAILGHDLDFPNELAKLFPHDNAKAWFEGNDPLIESTAFRNGTLQAAYFIIAARALGLDSGAMSGFDNEGVDKAFFADTNIKSNFLCNIGYGDPKGLFPRLPRYEFDEMSSII